MLELATANRCSIGKNPYPPNLCTFNFGSSNQISTVSSPSIAMALIYILAILSLGITLRLLLNFFTPGLHSIPGPFWAKFSNLWRLVSTARGHHEITLQKLHRLHGNVVRVGPNALSIADPEAIKSIYGFKTDFVKVCLVRSLRFCPSLNALSTERLHKGYADNQRWQGSARPRNCH